LSFQILPPPKTEAYGSVTQSADEFEITLPSKNHGTRAHYYITQSSDKYKILAPSEKRSTQEHSTVALFCRSVSFQILPPPKTAAHGHIAL
jgi:hypothetical protein